MYAMNNGADFRDAVNEVYSDDVNLLFTSIISFWFGSRQFAKLRNKAR